MFHVAKIIVLASFCRFGEGLYDILGLADGPRASGVLMNQHSILSAIPNQANHHLEVPQHAGVCLDNGLH